MKRKRNVRKKAGEESPKRPWKLHVLDFFIVAAVLGSIGFAIFGNRDEPVAAAYTCRTYGTQHRLELVDDAFSRGLLVINRCDTLTIENKDDLSYNLNFGEHDQHIDYPGYRAVTLLPDESVTIDAVMAGEYQLHDHFRDNATLKLDIRNTDAR